MHVLYIFIEDYELMKLFEEKVRICKWL